MNRLNDIIKLKTKEREDIKSEPFLHMTKLFQGTFIVIFIARYFKNFKRILRKNSKNFLSKVSMANIVPNVPSNTRLDSLNLAQENQFHDK